MPSIGRENGESELSGVFYGMPCEHEGPGHKISRDADPQTGERVLICDRCEEVFYLKTGLTSG